VLILQHKVRIGVPLGAINLLAMVPVTFSPKTSRKTGIGGSTVQRRYRRAFACPSLLIKPLLASGRRDWGMSAAQGVMGSAAAGGSRPLPVGAPSMLPFCIPVAPALRRPGNGLVQAQVCLNPVTKSAYHSTSQRGMGGFDRYAQAAELPAETAAGDSGDPIWNAAEFLSGVMQGDWSGLGPEAVAYASIVLPREDDMITLADGPARGQPVASEHQLKRRKRDWAPRETQFGSGAFWLFAQQGHPVREAAPRSCDKGSKECHADIWG